MFLFENVHHPSPLLFVCVSGEGGGGVLVLWSQHRKQHYLTVPDVTIYDAIV